MTALICLVVLLVGFRIAFRALPPYAQNLIAALLRGIGVLLSAIFGFAFQVLFITGNKGRKRN